MHGRQALHHALGAEDSDGGGGAAASSKLAEVLALPLAAATAAAAVASHRWVGRGDKECADQAAVNGMRRALAAVPGRGEVVIGEGEKDAAPMLYQGEVVGRGGWPAFDLAVDPLEGTRLCATGGPGAVSVIAAAPTGTLRGLAGYYMDKLVAGAEARGLIDLDAPIEANLASIAAARGVAIGDLTVAALARPRNAELCARARAAGAAVRELTDGDVMAALAVFVPGGGVDLVAGIGGAPEGVVTACAVRALGGEMLGRLAPQGPEERARVEEAGEGGAVFEAGDLARNSDVVFAASGVTSSQVLAGVRDQQGRPQVESIVVTPALGLVRIWTIAGAGPGD